MAQTAKSVTTLEIGSESMFQIPVSLKKISTRADVSLDTASPAGNPLKQLNVDIVTGETVENESKLRGLFRLKPSTRNKETWGEFVAIPPDALDVIEDVTKIESFTIDHFIPLKDVPFERVMDAFFLAPASGMSAKPLVLLAKALRKTKRAGVFKMVKTSRQYLAVVYEKDGGLVVNTLAWSADFGAYREAAEALDRADAKVSAQEMNLAAQLVEALGADAGVLDTYEDDLLPLRADLVDRALKGKPISAPKRSQSEPVGDDLEARLRATLAQSEGSASRRGRAPAPVG